MNKESFIRYFIFLLFIYFCQKTDQGYWVIGIGTIIYIAETLLITLE